MSTGSRPGSGRSVVRMLARGVWLFLTCALVALPAGCGGGEVHDAGTTPSASSPPATPGAQAIASPWQRGTADAAQTAEVAELYAVAMHDENVQDVVPYAAQATLDNWVTGTHVSGVDMIRATWVDWESGVDWSLPPFYVAAEDEEGRSGAAVLETVAVDHRRSPEVQVPCLVLLAVSDGRVIHEETFADPHLDVARTAGPTPCPEPEARGSDSAAWSGKVAGWLATAEEKGDWATLRTLYSADVVFLDTSRKEPLRGITATVDWHRAAGFGSSVQLDAEAPLSGEGWALLRWTARAADSEGDRISVPGVTMLEIRDGRIARETIYYDSSIVPLSR